MAFNFAILKANARRAVHETFGVPAYYKDPSLSSPKEIRARWHSKIDRFGDLDQQGYAEMIQGIDRVVFSAIDARTLNVKRGGVITFPDLCAGTTIAAGGSPGGSEVGPPAFVLNLREPADGPFEEIWLVTRKETA